MIRTPFALAIVAGLVACDPPSTGLPQCKPSIADHTPGTVRVNPWDSGTAMLVVQSFGDHGEVRPKNGDVADAREVSAMDSTWTYEVTCRGPTRKDTLKFTFSKASCAVYVDVECGDSDVASTDGDPTAGGSMTADATETGADTSDPTSGGDDLFMPNELPVDREEDAPGNITGGDDSLRIQDAVAEIHVQLLPSLDGGRIHLYGTSEEAPSGDLLPDGAGGAVWGDAGRNDYVDGMTVKDGDALTDIRIEGDVLTATWVRTNFDGTTWTSTIEIQLPAGTAEWFAGLPAAGPIDATATIFGGFSGGNLMISGMYEPGKVIECLLADGQRQKVRVDENGNYAFSFVDVVLASNGKVVAQIVDGAHQIAIEQFEG